MAEYEFQLNKNIRSKAHLFLFQTVEEQILEKPVDKQDAYKMLSRFILLK